MPAPPMMAGLQPMPLGACTVALSELRWSHDKINDHFRDYRSVYETAISLLLETTRFEDIPPLQVVQIGPNLYSLSNRRLFAFRTYERVRRHLCWEDEIFVPVEIVDLKSYDTPKFTTPDAVQGLSVEVSTPIKIIFERHDVGPRCISQDRVRALSRSISRPPQEASAMSPERRRPYLQEEPAPRNLESLAAHAISEVRSLPQRVVRVGDAVESWTRDAPWVVDNSLDSGDAVESWTTGPAVSSRPSNRILREQPELQLSATAPPTSETAVPKAECVRPASPGQRSRAAEKPSLGNERSGVEESEGFARSGAALRRGLASERALRGRRLASRERAAAAGEWAGDARDDWAALIGPTATRRPAATAPATTVPAAPLMPLPASPPSTPSVAEFTPLQRKAVQRTKHEMEAAALLKKWISAYTQVSIGRDRFLTPAIRDVFALVAPEVPALLSGPLPEPVLSQGLAVSAVDVWADGVGGQSLGNFHKANKTVLSLKQMVGQIESHLEAQLRVKAAQPPRINDVNIRIGPPVRGRR